MWMWYQVGSYYKEPDHAIWVVCSESHYSVLFQPDGVTGESPMFGLHYYDGLVNQQEVTILTVDLYPSKPPPDKPDDSQLIPPLDLVVRTKWPGAGVIWNIDPIL